MSYLLVSNVLILIESSIFPLNLGVFKKMLFICKLSVELRSNSSSVDIVITYRVSSSDTKTLHSIIFVS